MGPWPNPSPISTTLPARHRPRRAGHLRPAPAPPARGWWPPRTTVLLLLAGRYGYHRDELYFLLAGRHLDWGYVDQGPLVPALARLLDTIAPGNLVVLRTPSALIAGGAVLLVAAIARELGAGRGAQIFAAVLAALSGIVLASGHLLSTTTVDLLVWLAAAWCAVRLLRTGDSRWALGIGLALGVGHAQQAAAGAAGCGPARRGAHRRATPAAARPVGARRRRARRAAGRAEPDLAGRARLPAARRWRPPSPTGTAPTAAGSTRCPPAASSSARTPCRSGSPGLVALLRRPAWRAYRAVGWAWLVVFGIVLIAGGKGYYDAPLLLVLTAAGALVTVAWASRGSIRLRRGLLALGVVPFLLPNIVLLLPVLPADRLPGFVVDVNYDAGETIGWPAFADSLAAVHRGLPPRAALAGGHPDRQLRRGRRGGPVRSGPWSAAGVLRAQQHGRLRSPARRAPTWSSPSAGSGPTGCNAWFDRGAR